MPETLAALPHGVASAVKPLILIVDDTPSNLAVLFPVLSGHGYDVYIADSGESALRRLEQVRPDLIMLDVLMPGMDGFATCEQIKLRPQLRDVPVIFMTALADLVDKVRGFALGAVDYITKPFQQEEVVARVGVHIALQQLQRRLAESEQRLARIIDSALDAILAVDSTGTVTVFNAAAARMFRCTPAVARGQPIASFLSTELHARLVEFLHSSAAGPAMWLPEGYSARRDDGPFPIEATFSRIDAGGQNRCTIMLRDVQERHAAEAERQRLRGLTLYLQEELQELGEADQIANRCPSLRQVMQTVNQVALTDATVLITGETGSGKELIARALHHASARRERVMVKLNCAAIVPTLVESELFGHEKGAFTGAIGRKLGRFELADHGTLFLDEVGDLPLDVQAKLLRVLQEGEFERVGGTQTIHVDVRIIAATHRNLADLVQSAAFRSDLYYRLHVLPITVPPLRERLADFPVLVPHFIRYYARRYHKHIEVVPQEVLSVLQAHTWPGNIRELQHVIERAVILNEGPLLTLKDDLNSPKATGPALQIETLECMERTHIIRALKMTGGRISGKGGAAELLGLKRSTLESRMKKLGITRTL